MSSDLLSALNKNGSGLNLRELAQTLTTAETAPRLEVLKSQIQKDNVKLSALAQVRAQFQALNGALAQTATNPVLIVATTTAAMMPKVTDRNLLRPDSVPLQVQSLAARQVLEFAGFASGKAPVDAGALGLEFGRWAGDGAGFTPDAARPAQSLTIPPGTTLEGLAGILSAVPGITARVLDKGDGTVSLGIVSETGADNALRLAAAGTGGGGIDLSAFDTSASNAQRQVQAAADARVLVDGIAVSRPTNVIRDIMPGVEVTLSAVTSGTLTVERDEQAARTNIQTLVDGLNGVMGLLQSLTSRGVAGAPAGDLAGDRSIETLQQDLRRLIATPLSGFADRPIHLADLGIATERNGLFRFDPPAFDRTFRDRAGDFDALFGDQLRSLTDGLSVQGKVSSGLTSGDLTFSVDGAGNAQLGGYAMMGLGLGDGRRAFIALAGPVQGLSVLAEPGVTNGSLRFGRSLVGSLGALLARAEESTGIIGRRESDLDRSSRTASERMEALEARAAVVEKRYLTRFAAMEQAVTQMKSTGDYIQNLQKMWARDG
ncbi:flagellar filament capping protein FliD [Paracoccus sp. T5]|uniref:flagellar filament capping protein FliD n=1 Tax=Paracoccus sp. T5 TaxID=3402161 RepID=UPI003AEBC743